MKSAFAIFALTALALPAAAKPVELACNGTLTQTKVHEGGMPLDVMHVLVGEDTVVVSGGNHLAPSTYTIDLAESDAANLVFGDGDWVGILNRFSGKLTMWREPEHSVGFKGWLRATCKKADPLF
jgi:hypothetical protein